MFATFAWEPNYEQLILRSKYSCFYQLQTKYNNLFGPDLSIFWANDSTNNNIHYVWEFTHGWMLKYNLQSSGFETLVWISIKQLKIRKVRGDQKELSLQKTSRSQITVMLFWTSFKEYYYKLLNLILKLVLLHLYG